jgi:lysozyme
MWIKHILLYVLLLGVLNADPLRNYLVQWEGYSRVVYLCPAGTPTIGIGHNLSFEKQKAQYTQEDIENYYNTDVANSIRVARKYVSNFDNLPQQVRFVTISLIFTVGESGFVKFKKYRYALSRHNYRQAAYELRHSAWWSQVSSRRAKEHYLSLYTINPTTKDLLF